MGRRDDWKTRGIQLLRWSLTGGVWAVGRARLASVLGNGGGRSEARQSRKMEGAGRGWSTPH